MKKYNLWLRIEKADEDADEYEDLFEPVKLGSFGRLSAAVAALANTVRIFRDDGGGESERAPSDQDVEDCNRWYRLARRSERAE